MSAAQTSLYHRLGGCDAPAAAVDDLLPRLQGDPQLGVDWKGQNTHTKQRGRQNCCSTSSCRRSAARHVPGLGYEAAHQGLNITESDWAVMEGHAVAVLDKFGIQGRDREEFLATAASLKADIVQV